MGAFYARIGGRAAHSTVGAGAAVRDFLVAAGSIYAGFATPTEPAVLTMCVMPGLLLAFRGALDREKLAHLLAP
ncbi:hypothetical protein RA19_22910 [Leisingera sp. ANG-M1]|nr:hypothetical protein RA19_22910 [Leisingera sp. ANG-M1]